MNQLYDLRWVSITACSGESGSKIEKLLYRLSL